MTTMLSIYKDVLVADIQNYVEITSPEQMLQGMPKRQIIAHTAVT